MPERCFDPVAGLFFPVPDSGLCPDGTLPVFSVEVTARGCYPWCLFALVALASLVVLE